MEFLQRVRQSQQLSTLPIRMGGLSACWASGSHALRMISLRRPDVAHDVLHRFSLEVVRMFGRVARRIIRVGQQGLLETFTARTARGQAPSED